MRLIDVDAEIARIEEEIMKLTKAIERWQARKLEGSTIYDIDAKIQELQNNRTNCRVEIRTLRNYKTAFDVEKVVHELHNLRMDIFEKVKKGYPTETIEDYFNCGEMAGKSNAYRDAIEIVKRGGRDEDYWK